MKKAGFLIGSFMFVTLGFNQINITENDLPEAGYTYLVSADTLTAVTIGSASAVSQVWNYSNLLEHYVKFPTYDSTNNAPYATDFIASTHYTYGPAFMYSGFYGGAPVGTQGMDNGYMFWRRDATGFWIVGFRSDDGIYANKNVLNSQQELMIGTPATYATVFNNTAHWELNFNNNSANVDTLYINRVEKTLTADAFGEITTPVGNYPDVLRIHEYLITSDSIYGTLLGNPVYAQEEKRDTLNNYIFMDNVTQYPVCIVHADKNNVVLFVEYYKSFAVTEIIENPKEQISIYPNPTQQNFSVSLNSEPSTTHCTTLIIRDSESRIIYQQQLINKESLINLNASPGVYFVSVLCDDEPEIVSKLILTE